MHRLRAVSKHLHNTKDNALNNISSAGNYKDEKHAGDLIAHILSSFNVGNVFTLTGGHISPIIVACNKIRIRVIDVRDEVTTVFAADAQSRVNNINNRSIPGIAVVTAGPGLTNIITAVKNAQMAESPVIIFGGATSQIYKNRGSLQDINQIELLKPHCKKHFTLTGINDIIDAVYNAFKISLTGVPGPVFIECPWDVLYTKIKTNAYNKYIQKYNSEMYDLNKIYKPIKYKCENLIDYKLIINKLQTSNKPLMILGSQILNAHCNSNKQIEQLLNNLNILNIPIYLSGMSRGLTGIKHKLHFRHKRRVNVKECDLLLLLGVSCDFRLDYGRGINKDAYIIMVNIDNNALSINNDWRKREMSYHYHPSIFVQNLCNNLENKNKYFEWNEWFTLLNNRENKRENEINDMMIANEKKVKLIDPIRCCKVINNILNSEWITEDIYIIADGGDFVGTASYIIKPNKYLHWLDPGPFGTLGCGAGFGIGIKSLKPNSTVIILYGDGAFGWSIAEFDTFARHKLNVIAIIGNDACWTQIARGQISDFNDDTATMLNYTKYDEVVKPFGCKGFTVKTVNELKHALNMALKYSKQGYPVVVNALISTSNFRTYSISV